MLVVFANNQTLIAASGTTVTITTVTTDPVAVGRNNRATGITNTHSIFNAGAAGLTWKMQVSNDGVNWVDQGPEVPPVAPITATGTELQAPTAVSGVYARLMIAFQASAAGIGAAILDVHVNFDRS